MLVRQVTDDDSASVRAVHAAAFAGPRPDGTAAPEGEPVEAKLADELRTSGVVVPGLSLVAVVDGRVVGHVVGSRGRVTPGDVGAPGLGPLGVLPEAQGTGVGSALMHAVLGAADALGEPFVVLLGEPAYYRRFGFVAATEHGITPPDPAWGDYFQVRLLAAHRPDVAGTYRYAAPFDDL